MGPLPPAASLKVRSPQIAEARFNVTPLPRLLIIFELFMSEKITLVLKTIVMSLFSTEVKTATLCCSKREAFYKALTPPFLGGDNASYNTSKQHCIA